MLRVLIAALWVLMAVLRVLMAALWVLIAVLRVLIVLNAAMPAKTRAHTLLAGLARTHGRIPRIKAASRAMY